MIAPEQQPAFVRDLIRSRHIQALLISNSRFGYALLPYLRCYCPDVVVLDLLHTVETHWLDGGYPRLSLQQRAWIDLSITVSDDLRGWMIARGGDPERIVVSPAAIDVNVWNPAHFDRATIRQALDIPLNWPLDPLCRASCATKATASGHANLARCCAARCSVQCADHRRRS